MTSTPRDSVALEVVRGHVLDTADATSFAAWLQPSWLTLHRYAVRLAGTDRAEDLMQDTLVVAWTKRLQFDPQRGTARAWLIAILRDQMRKSHRRSVRHPPVVEATSPRPGPEPERIDVRDALAQLTDRQRETVSLFYYLDLPIEEVAQVLGCSAGTVKSTLSDARRRLAAILGADY